jgi:HlyD family secretion protein
MTANVTITTAKREGVLRVPLRALRFRPEGAPRPAAGSAPGGGGAGAPRDRSRSATVYVVADDALHPVEIQTGVRDAQYAEVLGGDLHEGDRIATGIKRPEEPAATPARPPGFAGGGRRF